MLGNNEANVSRRYDPIPTVSLVTGRLVFYEVNQTNRLTLDF